MSGGGNEQFHYSNLTFETDPSKTDLNAFFGLPSSTRSTAQASAPLPPPAAGARPALTNPPAQRVKFTGFDSDSQTSWEDILRREVGPSSVTYAPPPQQQPPPLPPIRPVLPSQPLRSPSPAPTPSTTTRPPPATPQSSTRLGSLPPPPSTPSITSAADPLSAFMSSSSQRAPQFSLSSMTSPRAQNSSQLSSQPIQDRWNTPPPLPAPSSSSSSSVAPPVLQPPASTFKAPRLAVPSTPSTSLPPPSPQKISASMFFNYPTHNVFGRNTSTSSASTTYESSDCFQIVSHYHELPCMIPGPASFYHEQHPSAHHLPNAEQQQQEEEEETSTNDVSLEQDKQLRIDRYFRQSANNSNSAWAQCKLQYPNSSELNTGKSTNRLELLVCVICKMSFFDKHYAVAVLTIESGDTIDAEITPNALFDMNWKEGTVLVLRNVALCRARLAPVTAIVTGANVVRIFTPNGHELVNLNNGNTQNTPVDLTLPLPSPLPPQASTSLLHPLPAASSSATSTQFQRNLHAMEEEENWEALASLLQAPAFKSAPNGNDLSWLEM
ncbi:hypothetical protein BASA81_000772 [Batrachochytrium salamandrivorans]|nr:hypothetical protein BASA81_000772 [Batrachochytrium salamandrivorans]